MQYMIIGSSSGLLWVKAQPKLTAGTSVHQWSQVPEPVTLKQAAGPSASQPGRQMEYLHVPW
jgi:hypothetical protein